MIHREWRHAEVYVRQEQRGNAWHRLLYLRCFSSYYAGFSREWIIHFPLHHEMALRETMEMVVDQALLNDRRNIMQTYQGEDMVAILFARITTPTQVLRVFPVKSDTNEEHRDVTDGLRIAAFVARYELSQPDQRETDELLRQLWDGTDAANWTDEPSAVSETTGS